MPTTFESLVQQPSQRASGTMGLALIVGVAADQKYESLHDAAPPTVYLHAFQEARGRVSQFALRTSVPPASIAGQARRVVQDASQTIAVNRIGTLADQLDASIVLERLLARGIRESTPAVSRPTATSACYGPRDDVGGRVARGPPGAAPSVQ